MTRSAAIELTVVLDNVVRLREQQLWPYPDPLKFAQLAARAGADGVFLGLQISHVAISDRSWQLLRDLSEAKLCLAVPPRAEILRKLAESTAARCVLIPGSRHEHSSGGSLDLSSIRERLPLLREQIAGTDIELAAQIDPDLHAVARCADAGLPAVEFNTAAYALAGRPASRDRRLRELITAVAAARAAKMRVSVRGGLDYRNIAALGDCAGISEFRIGQALISQALFYGLQASVARMRDLLGG